MAFSTLYEFCRSYGPDRFAELVRLLNDRDETHASIAVRFGVTSSCVTRWASKFCDVHIILKQDVLSYLESLYEGQVREITEASSIIESQRRELRLIKDGKDDRADEDVQEQP